MPKCYKCGSPIVFVNTAIPWSHPTQFSAKSVPVDIDPSPAGAVALYKWPVLFKGSTPANGVDPVTVGRRMEGEARRQFLLFGGKLYSIHFDTCNKR